jgi:hypothetical protein
MKGKMGNYKDVIMKRVADVQNRFEISTQLFMSKEEN